MHWSWRDLAGLGLFLALFSAAVMANVSEGSISRVRGAWVTQAVR
jgi:hypothetical protein